MLINTYTMAYGVHMFSEAKDTNHGKLGVMIFYA
jgi:hypothetical protein